MWRIPCFNLRTFTELAAHLALDGVRMGGTISSTPNLLLELTGDLRVHPASPPASRLYKFCKRLITCISTSTTHPSFRCIDFVNCKLSDRDDALMLNNVQLHYPNAIVAIFVWGVRGRPKQLQ
ncbi:hypothetical protein ACGC1H_001253 [Rhizoctonia solani]